MDDWIDITAKSLDIAGAVDFVTDAGAGGIDVFLGQARFSGPERAISTSSEACSSAARAGSERQSEA